MHDIPAHRPGSRIQDTPEGRELCFALANVQAYLAFNTIERIDFRQIATTLHELGQRRDQLLAQLRSIPSGGLSGLSGPEDETDRTDETDETDQMRRTA